MADYPQHPDSPDRHQRGEANRLMSLRELSFAAAVSDLLQKSDALKQAEASQTAGGSRGQQLLSDLIRAAKRMTDEYEKYSASKLQLQFGDRAANLSDDPYRNLVRATGSRTRQKSKPMGEAEFEELAKSKGWRAEKRGWPTYLCSKESGEVLAVNVSPVLRDGSTKRLSRSRSEVMACLQEIGLRSFVFNGETLEPFDLAVHSPSQNAFGRLNQSPMLRTSTIRQRFKKSSEEKGWATFGTGWPDYACFGPNGELIAVEVKRRFSDGTYEQLQPHQAQVASALVDAGMRCYISNGTHLETFKPEKHGWLMMSYRPPDSTS